MCGTCGLERPPRLHRLFLIALAVLRAAQLEPGRPSASAEITLDSCELITGEAIAVDVVAMTRVLQACLDRGDSAAAPWLPTRVFRAGPALAGRQKMSKSAGNFVDLDAVVDANGADAVRLALLWTTRLERNLDWQDVELPGIHRFLRRLWAVEVRTDLSPEQALEGEALAEQVAELVAAAIAERRFHITRTPLQQLVGHLNRYGASPKAWTALIAVTAPLCPIITRELIERSAVGSVSIEWPSPPRSREAFSAR